MSKSSEEARQWMNDNVTEDDQLGVRQYNDAMNELFMAIKPEEDKSCQ
jgi:hypothetical protein